jgi:hypothetical protein
VYSFLAPNGTITLCPGCKRVLRSAGTRYVYVPWIASGRIISAYMLSGVGIGIKVQKFSGPLLDKK